MKKSSGLTWLEYAARQVNAKMSGSRIPSVEECIITTFEDGKTHERAEVVHNVWTLTGIDKREVESHISGVLRKLEGSGSLVHSGHNVWRKSK